MSNGQTGSTLPRRALGRQMHIFRERADVSRSAAGRALGVSLQTIARLEEGLRTKVTDLYVNTLADRYRVSDEERRMLLGLAVEIRTTTVSDGSWWRAHPDLDSRGFDHFNSLEASATEVFTWQPALVPGILQTTEYRRTMAWAKFPDIPGERLEQMLNVATQRQKRLYDSDFRVDAVISESVLRHHVGSNAVMADQLTHMLDLSELPNVSVRVVPFMGDGEIGQLTSNFVVFWFPPLPATKLRQSPIASIERFTGAVFVEQEPHLSHYFRAAERISRIASDPLESQHMLREAVKEWSQ